MTSRLPTLSRYTFRFESAHGDGRRVTHTTTLLGRSEAEGRARLAELLGGRYEIVLLERTPAAEAATAQRN
jgi:hypothetical protein